MRDVIILKCYVMATVVKPDKFYRLPTGEQLSGLSGFHARMQFLDD